MCEAAIVAILCGIGMYPCLYRPEIVTSGQHHGVYTIHDPFIMGNGPVWFCIGNGNGTYNFPGKLQGGHVLFLIKCLHRALYLGFYKAARDIIGQDAHNNVIGKCFI